MMKFSLTRRALLSTAGGLVVLNLQDSSMATDSETAVDPTSGRNLVFDENFETLDPLIWNAGPKATTFDSGFYGRAAFSRLAGEEGFNPYNIIDDHDATGGKALEITARYIGRKMNVPGYYGNDLREYQWISGNIQTARRDGTITKAWRNGYLEVRMKVPAHPLSFPAFWLMNGRSILFPQTSVELDIIEHKGTEPSTYGAYLHEWGTPGEHHEGVGVNTGDDITKGYFRFGIMVAGADCSLYFERNRVRDPATGKPLAWKIGRAGELDTDSDAFWPLLTLALRSDVPFPTPLQEADRSCRLLVDYLRVYQ